MFVQILCIEAHFCNILSKHFHFPHYRLWHVCWFFFNRSMLTSRTTMFKNNRAKLAKLFMLVILIGLFFRQWFTHFCDIYVFLLQFRRIFFFFLNPQFPFKVWNCKNNSQLRTCSSFGYLDWLPNIILKHATVKSNQTNPLGFEIGITTNRCKQTIKLKS